MSLSEQIRAFKSCSLESALAELKANRGVPLTKNRLHHYLERSIDDGLVQRVLSLARLLQLRLTQSQMRRLIRRCLELRWFADAVHASQHWPLSRRTRQELITALVEANEANDAIEAAQLIDGST